MCTLRYSSKWHQDLPGKAHSEEFGEGMFSWCLTRRNKGVLLVLRR